MCGKNCHKAPADVESVRGNDRMKAMNAGDGWEDFNVDTPR